MHKMKLKTLPHKFKIKNMKMEIYNKIKNI